MLSNASSNQAHRRLRSAISHGSRVRGPIRLMLLKRLRFIGLDSRKQPCPKCPRNGLAWSLRLKIAVPVARFLPRGIISSNEIKTVSSILGLIASFHFESEYHSG